MTKLNKAERSEFRKTAYEFLACVKDEVESCLALEDVKRLNRLITQVEILLDHELMQIWRDKGLDKEITKLSDKAGRLKKKEVG